MNSKKFYKMNQQWRSAEIYKQNGKKWLTGLKEDGKDCGYGCWHIQDHRCKLSVNSPESQYFGSKKFPVCFFLLFIETFIWSIIDFVSILFTCVSSVAQVSKQMFFVCLFLMFRCGFSFYIPYLKSFSYN